MYIRYEHNDGKGLLNNQGLDYDRLSDNESFKIEHFFLQMQQPPSGYHGKQVIFAFKNKAAEKRWLPFIKLLKKMSRTGIKRIELDPSKYDVDWETDDGQVALVPKKQASQRFFITTGELLSKRITKLS